MMYALHDNLMAAFTQFYEPWIFDSSDKQNKTGFSAHRKHDAFPMCDI